MTPHNQQSRKKLTSQQINEARYRYQHSNPKPTIQRLAQIYNVSYNTMWRILRSINPHSQPSINT